MPLIIYKNSENKRISGVTTIISSLGWNKQALMYWAWNEGIEGRNFRDTSQKAANIGTIAHAMIEADLKGKEFDSSKFDKDMIDKAETAYLAWLEWKELVSFNLLESEKSLISEEHQFGGTIDIAVIKNVTAILDLKTSKDIYSDHKIQIAAYGKLWDENYPNNPIQAYYILQLGKEDGSFHYHYWPSLEEAWEAFLALLKLHQLKKKI